MIQHRWKQILGLSQRCRWGILLTTLLFVMMTLPTMPRAIAEDDFKPPDRGLPGRRKGGGTRNLRCVNSERTLTALTPVSNLGFTIAEYPQIFWFVPEHKAAFIEVSLYGTNSDLQDTDLLFLSQFKTSGQQGIGQFKVPSGINFIPLDVGKTYHWYISLMCDADDRAQDITVSGWLERVPPSEDLKAAKNLKGVDRYRALARAGLWFDALDFLTQLNCQNQTEVGSLWKSLMNNPKVDLPELSDSLEPKSCGSGTH
jgi:hypothetical protein